MTNNNFKWLTYDIDSSMVLKVIYDKDKIDSDYAIYNVIDVLEVTGDKLDIETANIDDLTNLLTVGIVRFVNVSDINDVLDIPFRNLYKLYENSNILGEKSDKMMSFEEMNVFSVIDGNFRNNYLIFSTLIDDISDDLYDVMKIAYEFGSYGMQEKFDALTKITMINHRRIINDDTNMKIK